MMTEDECFQALQANDFLSGENRELGEALVQAQGEIAYLKRQRGYDEDERLKLAEALFQARLLIAEQLTDAQIKRIGDEMNGLYGVGLAQENARLRKLCDAAVGNGV